MKKKLFRLFAVAAMMSISLCTWAESGTSTEASQGAFQENGYSYEFTTSGTSVTIKFTFLDSYDGLVAYFWNYTNELFVETGMPVSGNTATITLTNQKPASTISFACKIAYAGGGLAVTKQFSYIVEGEDTGGEGGNEEDKPTGAFCQGSDTVKSDGQSFTDGYDYLIQTIGSGDTYSVQVTVKFKDNRTGVVAYMQDFTSGGLVETQINFDVASKTTSYVFTSVADLDELSFRIKFAFAGGLSTTKAFIYTVGTDCNGQRPVVEEEDEEDETTALQQVNKSKVESQKSKVIIDGNLYILRDGQLFNAQGARL